MYIPESIKKLTTVIHHNGGKCLLIGGAVIDSIANREIKDWDIEVYGLNYSQLTIGLTKAGYSCDVVGKAFGIIKTKAGDLDIDLSLPRMENKCGIGHKGFSVELCPDMSPKEAGRRRDLTINSMYLDLGTQELIDPFGGLEDLRKGIIRATASDTFVEDPLRVLRIMQLLPRKGKVVDPGTIELCRSMLDEFPTLPAERVFEEWCKLLLKAETPSLGLEFLRDSHWIKWFPELEALIGCQQNPEWHPEGDVWNHTLMVLDNAAILQKEITEEWRLAFMFGALLHDVGKPSTTTDDLRSPGHDVAGVSVAEHFMRRITNNKTLIERVLLIVGNHMQPGQLQMAGAGPAAWRRLHNKIRLDVIAMMSKADSNGRTGRSLSNEHMPSTVAMDYFHELGNKPIAPALMGRHLIEAGYKPGPEFKVILNQAYEYQLEHGCTDVAVLLTVATGHRKVGK